MGMRPTQPSIEVRERTRPDAITRPETPKSKRRRSQLPPPLLGPDIIHGPVHKDAAPHPDFGLLESFSSKGLNKRRDSSHCFSKGAENAGREQLQTVVPAVGKAIECETDPLTTQYLIAVIQEAARKGCSVTEALPAIAKCLESGQPFSITEKALRAIDHAIDSDHNISPLLESLLRLLVEPESKKIVSDILKKYASKDPSNAWQVKHAIDTSSIHKICTGELIEHCDKMIPMEAIRSEIVPKSDPPPVEKGTPSSTRYAISSPHKMAADPEIPAGKTRKAKSDEVKASIKISTKPPGKKQKDNPADGSPVIIETEAHLPDPGKYDKAAVSSWVAALSSGVGGIRCEALDFFERNLHSAEMARFILPILPSADHIASLPEGVSAKISASVETVRKSCCKLLKTECERKKKKES